MKAASKFTYINADDDDEDEVELNDRDSLWDEAKPASVASITSTASAIPSAPPIGNVLKKKVKKLDTNVLSITLSTLTNDAVLATGDPLFCASCKSAFSATSKLEDAEGVSSTASPDGKNWICEFCSTSNFAPLSPEEIPKDESVDYILEPPTTTVSTDDIIIYCLDISGSMGVTYELEGKVNLRGDHSKKLSDLNTDRSDQRLPRERRNITYVSRLQCVQAAVEAQMEQIYRDNPTKRVALITFNSDVAIIGDGTQKTEVITGDKLNEFDTLLQFGQSYKVNNPIKNSKEQLSKKLYSIEEEGSTALGPAIVVAVGMASQYSTSKIVLCTDGVSNKGLGTLEDLFTEDAKEAADKFYDQVAAYAKIKAINISVITIQGTDCKLEKLGKLSDETAGIVDIVDPLNITKNFQSILSVPVIATHVSTTFMVHKGLYIKSDDDSKRNSETRDIGNVTSESEITFEYGVRKENIQEFKNLKSLPFQIQIRYTKLNGTKCVRIITKAQPITFDRAQAEAEADNALLGTYAVQKTAQVAQKGDYLKARLLNLQAKKLMSKVATANTENATYFKNWKAQGEQLERELYTEQQKELDSGISIDDDCEEEDEAPVEMEKEKRSKVMAKPKAKARVDKRGDKVANMIYNMKQTNSKSLKK